MAKKISTTAYDFLLAIASPDVLGVLIVGWVIIRLVATPTYLAEWLISLVPGGAAIVLFISSTSFGTVIIIMGVLALLRFKTVLNVAMITFIAFWVLQFGIILHYSRIPWWILLNIVWTLLHIPLPAQQFAANAVAKFFILMIGAWVVESLYHFRSLRREMRASGIMTKDLQEVLLYSTLVLVVSAFAIGSIVYGSYLLIS